MWKCDNAQCDLKCVILKCLLRFLRLSPTIMLLRVGHVPRQSTVQVKKVKVFPVPDMKTPLILKLDTRCR